MNFVGIVCIFLIGSCYAAEHGGDGTSINGENATDISHITEVTSIPETTVKPITSSTEPPVSTSTTTTSKTPSTTPNSTSIKTSTTPVTTTTKSTSTASTKAPTSTSIAPNVTKSPDPTPVPSKDRGFSGPSFVGGIVLTLGLMAIGFIGFKLNRRRQEGQNYHTL